MPLFPGTHCELRQIKGEKLRLGSFPFTVASRLMLIVFVKGEMGLTPKTNQDLPSIEIWILKYRAPVKVTKAPWRNSLEWSQGKYRTSLGHLAVLENKGSAQNQNGKVISKTLYELT